MRLARGSRDIKFALKMLKTVCGDDKLSRISDLADSATPKNKFETSRK
jgi:hypothetical protein